MEPKSQAHIEQKQQTTNQRKNTKQMPIEHDGNDFFNATTEGVEISRPMLAQTNFLAKLVSVDYGLSKKGNKGIILNLESVEEVDTVIVGKKIPPGMKFSTFILAEAKGGYDLDSYKTHFARTLAAFTTDWQGGHACNPDVLTQYIDQECLVQAMPERDKKAGGEERQGYRLLAKK